MEAPGLPARAASALLKGISHERITFGYDRAACLLTALHHK